MSYGGPPAADKLRQIHTLKLAVLAADDRMYGYIEQHGGLTDANLAFLRHELGSDFDHFITEYATWTQQEENA